MPGAVQTLQRHLDNSDPEFAQSISSADTSVPYDSNSDPVSDRFEEAKDFEIDSVRRQQKGSIYDELRNRDLDFLARHRTQVYTLWLLPFLCKTTRQWEDFHIPAFDIIDRLNSPDTELFIDIKKRYSKAKGVFGGFLSPRVVKTIEATHVRSLQVTNTCMWLTSSS